MENFTEIVPGERPRYKYSVTARC